MATEIKAGMIQEISGLAYAVHIPMCNICLSAEMLTPFLLCDESKLYLEIILRNAGRVNDVVSQHLNGH